MPSVRCWCGNTVCSPCEKLYSRKVRVGIPDYESLRTSPCLARVFHQPADNTYNMHTGKSDIMLESSERITRHVIKNQSLFVVGVVLASVLVHSPGVRAPTA